MVSITLYNPQLTGSVDSVQMLQNDSIDCTRCPKKIKDPLTPSLFLSADINFTHTYWLSLSSNCSYGKAILKEFKNLNNSSLQSHASSLDIFLSNIGNFWGKILEETSFSEQKYWIAEISIEHAEQDIL